MIRYDKQVSALLLRDMTIIKFMLSTVLVGMVGVYLLKDLGLVKLQIKTLTMGGVILGGPFLRRGLGLAGLLPVHRPGRSGRGPYGPLSSASWACSPARRSTPKQFPALKTSVLTWGDYGKLTLPQLLGVNHWMVIAVFVAGSLGLFCWFEKKAGPEA